MRIPFTCVAVAVVAAAGTVVFQHFSNAAPSSASVKKIPPIVHKTTDDVPEQPVIAKPQKPLPAATESAPQSTIVEASAKTQSKEHPKKAIKKGKAPNPRRNLFVKIYEQMRHAVVSVTVRRPGYTKDTTGTGVVVDERGIIITNRHVVGDSKQVRIGLSDGFKVAGQVVASEPNQDLAIIYIKTNKKLSAATLAPTKDMMVGEDVMAIGHPYGYANTVTRGGISALNRTITLPNGVELKGLIQHDASINPGNSGGPLLNMNGEVIGVNVALREDAQGIAFAINAQTVKTVLRKHLNAKRLAGVYIGMNFDERILGEIGDRQRIVVAGYEWKEKPILQKGDVILQIGTMKIRNAFDLERSLWSAQPKQTVAVRILRDNAELVVQLPLYESESRPRVAQIPPPVRQALTSTIRSVSVKKPLQGLAGTRD